MSTPRTGRPTPQGGWLRRIETGAAAFSDGGDERGAAAAPPRMTPRLAQVSRDMFNRWRADPDAFHTPREVADTTGVPLGTVAPLLNRLQAANCAVSQVAHGARSHQLTHDGALAIAEALTLDEFPAAGLVGRLMVEEARASVALDGQTRSVGPVTVGGAQPARRPASGHPDLMPAPPGREGWTATELAELDVELAAAVRRAMGWTKR